MSPSRVTPQGEAGDITRTRTDRRGSAVGGLVVGPLAGVLVARSSSARVWVVALPLIAQVRPIVGLAPSRWVLAIALLWIGVIDLVMDGAMNAHGLRVQRSYGRSSSNSFHAYWSLGMVTGAVAGSVWLAVGFSISWMLVVIAVASIAAVALTAGWLLPGKDPHNHLSDVDAAAEATMNADPSSIPLIVGRGSILNKVTVLLSVFTLLAVIIGDTPARWSSIYVTDIGTTESLVGVGFTAFTIAMRLTRFAGDLMVNRFGGEMAVRVSMAISGLTLVAALLIGTTWAYIAACIVIGAGVATVGWLARAGFVAALLAVGAVADRPGIAWGLTVPVRAASILIPPSAILRPRKAQPATRTGSSQYPEA